MKTQYVTVFKKTHGRTGEYYREVIFTLAFEIWVGIWQGQQSREIPGQGNERVLAISQMLIRNLINLFPNCFLPAVVPPISLNYKEKENTIQ